MIVKRLNHFTELSHKSDSKGVTVVTVLYNFTMDTITFTQTCLTFPTFFSKMICFSSISMNNLSSITNIPGIIVKILRVHTGLYN